MKNLTSNNKVLNAVLTASNDKIQHMVTMITNWENKKRAENNLPNISKFAIESIELNLIFDMCKAIEKYTDKNDQLIKINFCETSVGSFIISAEIERNGINYDFNTEVISAGGWNIQCFHYRYITKTNLPKTDVADFSNELKNEIKRISKIERIKQDIEYLTKQNNILKEEIEALSRITNSQIISEGYFAKIDWADMISRGADKNFENEQAFNVYKKECEINDIKRHENSINWKKRSIRIREVDIKKLNAKLEKLN